MGTCLNSANTQQNLEPTKLKGPTEQEITMARLKNMRDQLKDRQKQLTLSEEKSEQEIKKCLAENRRDKAAFALKRKKLFSEYLKGVDDKYIWTQRAILEVERAMQDKNLNDVMKETNNLLRDIQKGIDLNQFSELSDNMNEADQRQKEFNQLFDTYHVGQEEEVNNELKKYEVDVMKSEFDRIDEANPKFQYNQPQNQQHGGDNDMEKRLAELI